MTEQGDDDRAGAITEKEDDDRANAERWYSRETTREHDDADRTGR